MEKKSKVVSKRLQKHLKELIRNGQLEEAAIQLEPVAQEGNHNAQYQLGKLLFDTMIDKKDYTGIEKVVYWYEEATKQGCAKAMETLGELYFPGTWDACMRDVKQSPTFTLQTDLSKSLSYFVQASEKGERLWANSCSLFNLFHSVAATVDMKNEVKQTVLVLARKGNCDAAYHLLDEWWWHFRCPDRVPDILHLTQKELLHADWFLALLNYEVECQKRGEHKDDAIRLLDDFAKKGDREALDILTNIGLQVGGLVACWAGNIHYECQEYEKALECYVAGEDFCKLGEMYERGEGTAPDAEKAFHYYVEAEDYYNMGRMYEQGIGVGKDLQKAFECYYKIVDREIYESDSEEWKEEILSTRRAFRRLKKMLFAQKDEIKLTVVTKETESICGFSLTGYGDCRFTIDWGDGQTDEINNEKEEVIHTEHTYSREGEWNICLRSDETHTITSFHYTCEACTLKALNVTLCPILTDLYCVNQALKRLDVSRNPRLERLVCRRNKLQTLNIRKNNHLTQLDCSDNPLNYLNWHPRYSVLLHVCIQNTILLPDQYGFLNDLLKRNDGREVNAISKDSSEKLRLNLAYYMRCCNWKDIKEEVKNGVTSGKIHTWEKYRQAFAKICSMQVGKTNTDGKWKIVSDGWVHGEYNLGNADYSPQDIEDVHMSWSEWLATPVEVAEKEGWMMLPLTKHSEIAGQCFLGMTYENKWCDINLLKSRNFNL